MSYTIIKVKLEKLQNEGKRGWKSDDNKFFIDRLKEYDGELEVYSFEWGESVRKELV